MDRVELLEAAPEPTATHVSGDSREMHRHVRFVPEPLVEAPEQRAAAGEHDTAIHDVRGELGGVLSSVT